MKNVSIIGGGLAGLAAAVALAGRGIPITLFERRPILGGRAYSVKDNTTGDTIDNGQHIMMGCYHHTLRFLEKIGTLPLLQFQEKMRVDFADPQGKTHRLACPNLPAPLHLLGGLLGLKTLSWKEKWAMIRMMRRVKKLNLQELECLDQLTAQQWLILMGQTQEAIKNFWEPIIVGTINELSRLSSAKMLAIVIREALLKDRKDSLMLLSTVGLSDLYTEAAKNFIEKRGGKVFVKRGIAKIDIQNSRVEKLLLEDGTEQRADFFICAVPPDAFLSMVDGSENGLSSFLFPLKKFKFSPILSINLWFDRPILEDNFVGLLDSPIHWAFNKGKILNLPLPSWERDGVRGHYVSLVISAAHDLKDLGQEELVQLALKALHQAIPHSKDAQLKHSRILKELKATPSFTTGMDPLRPPFQTPLQNLFLAGDWTATGLPATIEGAVKSGHIAAENILKLTGSSFMT